MNVHNSISEPSKLPQTALDPIGALQALDWSFQNRTQKSGLESIHPYPAKFIPDIPGALLDVLPIDPGTAVFDPFVGSGTTLVECQRRGIPAVGVDINPIACLISRVKTQKLPCHFDNVVDQVVDGVAKYPSFIVPNIPNLDHWFSPDVRDSIARITIAINASPAASQDALRLALSSIIVRVSNQDSDTRYAAIEKNVSAPDVLSLFTSSCKRLKTALLDRDYGLTEAAVLERDTLSIMPSDFSKPIGAVITSPPYPNAYEYWLYHKYRMWWLGHDPLRVKELEIGARAHFFKKDHHTADTFLQQMSQTFALISSVLTQKGYACFVVGRSKIHGKLVDNAELIETAAKRHGFSRVLKQERVISATRKSFNLSHANIKTETILVLARTAS